MPSDLPQRKARRFLNEHLQSQEPFSKLQFQHFTGWNNPNTFRTYWSKQIKPFVVKVGNGQFRVSEGYRPYTTWKRFQRHATQVRPVAADYEKIEYERVIVYEFFMPLTNEAALRSTLDALFYKDNVVPKLKAIGLGHLATRIPRQQDEGDAAYLDRLCGWVGDHFGGYSIYHVDGRFLGRGSRAGRPALPRRRDDRGLSLHLPVRDRPGSGTGPLLFQRAFRPDHHPADQRGRPDLDGGIRNAEQGPHLAGGRL